MTGELRYVDAMRLLYTLEDASKGLVSSLPLFIIYNKTKLSWFCQVLWSQYGMYGEIMCLHELPRLKSWTYQVVNLENCHFMFHIDLELNIAYHLRG
uniref:Uncharacterized protein n=1 Tax=Rhizophora mucronata TaxID=61149 RepID=A0A2P2MF84_RHIMU